MDSQLVTQLDSADAAQRKAAVRAMAKSADPEYISYLTAFSRTETDSELSNLALKAVAYIKQQATTTEWSGDGSKKLKNDEPASVVEVSAANQRKASEMLDRAMNLNLARDDEGARALIQKAYQTDPTLMADAYKRGVVMQVLGIPNAEDALAALQMGSGGGGKEKDKRKNSADDVSTATAFTDVLIYGLVTGAASTVLVILMITFFRPIITELIQQEALYNEVGSATVAPLMDMLNGLMVAGIGLSLVYGVVVMIFSMITLVIQSFFINMVATTFMGGVGSMTRLIHKTATFLAFTTVVSFVFAIISFYFQAQAFSAADFTATTAREMQSQMAAVSPIQSVLQLISTVVSLVFLYYYFRRVAQAYDFSWARGCSAAILGNLLISMIACGCFFALFAVIGASTAAAFSGMVTMMP